MNKENLLEYLKAVLELEKNKHESQQILDNLKQTSYRAEYHSPQQYPSPPIGAILILIIISFIISLFLSVAVDSFICLKLCLFAWIAGLIIYTAFRIKRSIDAKTYATNATKQSEEDTKKRNEILSNSIVSAKEAFDDTVQSLEKSYSANIIHPKYRNIIAIASFYEYFETGRCDALEGPNGAYSLYETESRLDKIIDQIDVVISNLENIRQNQYTLYCAIKETTSQISSLTNQIQASCHNLDKIAANTAMNAYTTNIIKENLYYNRTFETDKNAIKL